MISDSIVALSHVSDDTMRDVLGGDPMKDWPGSIAPPIFSHSSVRAICPHPRNVPDDILQLVRKRMATGARGCVWYLRGSSQTIVHLALAQTVAAVGPNTELGELPNCERLSTLAPRSARAGAGGE